MVGEIYTQEMSPWKGNLGIQLPATQTESAFHTQVTRHQSNTDMEIKLDAFSNSAIVGTDDTLAFY
jgi:hypothetical protein